MRNDQDMSAAAAEIEWTSTSTGDSVVDEILKNPVFTLSGKNIEQEELYSRNQLITIFRLGYSKGSKETEKKMRFNCYGPYRALKDMEINDTLEFPYELWASVRAAASTIKKQFGCTFKVNKQGFGKKGNIIVKRLN